MSEHIEHSVLEHHRVEFPDLGKSVAFVTYYNDFVATYVDVLPFARLCKFVDEKRAIRTIPHDWMRTASSFKDPKFAAHRIPPDTMFVILPAINHLIVLSKSESGLAFIQRLNDTTFLVIENARLLKMATELHHLKKSTKEVKETHSTALDVIHSAIKEASDNHSVLHKVFVNLCEQIKKLKLE